MGICAICGNNESQLKPLAYEARNTLICQTCYEQIWKIRNGKALDKVQGYEAVSYLFPRISDLAAQKYVDELLKRVEKEFDTPEYKEQAEQARKEAKLRQEKIDENIRKTKILNEQLAVLNEQLADYKNFMMTTGYTFEGYAIKKYVRVISGECVLGTGFLSEFESSLSDFWGTNSSAFSTKLDQAKENSTKQLVAEALSLEANAIIGVDFDYITFSNNMLGVVANGTCVVIEPVN